MRQLSVAPMLMLLMLTGCHQYMVARVVVKSEVVATDDQGIPGEVAGTVENRAANDAILDSRHFTWIPGKEGKQTFDFKVEQDTKLVTLLEYPGGASTRKTTTLPSKPSGGPWPFPITIKAVDVTTQIASIEYLTKGAETLSLVGSTPSEATTPPSTNFEQVAKYMGALTIVGPSWDATKDVLSEYIANVRVLQAPPAPVAGLGIQRKLCITNDAKATAALNVPVYGSLGASVAANQIYKMNLDITHNAILDLDQGIFGVLLDSKSKEGTSALVQLKYWASIEPNAKILVLRAVRYIVRGTIGVTQGKTFDSTIDASVASVFTSNAAFSFNLNDELYVPLTGNITAWVWKLQTASLSDFVKKVELARGTESGGRTGEQLTQFLPSGSVKVRKVP
jgi:hypothetical protein